MPTSSMAIGLGSNLGDRVNYLQSAVAAIARHIGHIADCSSIYQTAPFGSLPQPDFLNAALLVDSQLNPEDALSKALNIEAQLGRKRGIHNGPRTIDIDLLVWGRIRSNTHHLQLPHPRLHLRRFALIPLAELSPRLQPPGWPRDVAATLAACGDPLPVEKLQKFARETNWWMAERE